MAAHLDPEVLIVDEVLAVGDTEFQKKCLGKMQDISEGGRTVFFVSHNMEAVQRLCSQVLLMEKGRVRAQGDRAEIISRYLASGSNKLRPRQKHNLSGAHRRGSGEARFVKVSYSSETPGARDRAFPEGPLEVSLGIDSDISRRVSSLAVLISDRVGNRLVNADSLAKSQLVSLCQGRTDVKLRIDQLHLTPGTYTLTLWLAEGQHVYDQIEQAVQFEVVDPPDATLSLGPSWGGCVPCRFSLQSGV